ncbi:hypothetical protein Tco_0666317 [Tanacetum coccineum]
MSAITDIRCALTRKAFDAFCTKYHIPEEVHPVLPSQNDTIHERPAGKIGLYTRIFAYANFRLPLSSFLVDVLRHFRINISQLSMIGAAKNGRIYFSKHSDNAPVCYTKPLDSLKNWNNHFFWVDDFACPIRFSWHSAKNVTMDPALAAADFSAQDYATLVAHPSPFWKFPEEFLCLVGLSRHYTLDEETYPLFLDKDGEDEYINIFAFIHTLDPTKVKVAERQRVEGEPRLLETTVGRTVPLLLVAPDRAEGELEASGGGGGEGVNIQPVIEVADVAENVAPVQPRCQKKRKTLAADAGGPSHPPKKLREDHGILSGPSVAGKSRSAVHRLLVGAVLNAKVRGEPVPTLPFVTSSVSATPEREDVDHTDSVTGLNLRTISAPQRFVISSDSSHHSGANITEAEMDSFSRPFVPVITAATTITSTADPAVAVKEKVVKPSIFSTNSTSADGTDPAMGGFTDLTGSDLLVGGIRTVIDPESDLHKVYIPQWNVTNGSRLDDGGVCREMFNAGIARQMSLSAKVMMCAKYNIRKRRRLKSVVEEKDALLKVRDEEIGNLKAQLLLKEAEVAEAIRLHAEASKFEAVEKSLQGEVEALKERNTTLEKEKNEMDVKVVDLVASVKVREQEVANLDVVVTSVKSQNDNLVNQVHELEVSSAILQEKVTVYENCMDESFYPHLLTTIAGRMWLLTHDMELVIAKCLNSPEYLSALGAAIGKAIKKGMQDGLAAGITHGREGRVLADVAAYIPSAEVDYVSALQQLQSVNFSLLAELKLNKDSSVENLMNMLRLEETLTERLVLNESQPHVDQLMVPIHHSPNQTIICVTALSLALDVSNIRVQKIRDNITNHRSALRDVFITLAEPLSTIALEGTKGTSGTDLDTTTALSVTFASASSIPPISTDDYKVVPADGQEGAGVDGQVVANENADPFPNVDDAELNIS